MHICITFYEKVKSSLSQELFPKKNKSKNYNKGIYVKLQCVLFQTSVGLIGSTESDILAFNTFIYLYVYLYPCEIVVIS